MSLSSSTYNMYYVTLNLLKNKKNELNDYFVRVIKKMFSLSGNPMPPSIFPVKRGSFKKASYCPPAICIVFLLLGCSVGKVMVSGGRVDGSRGIDVGVGWGSNSAVKNIYFDFDSDEIRDIECNNIFSNFIYLNEHNELDIFIEGNCDERGTEEYNFCLGQRRAEVVRDYFINSGLDSKRIWIISYGEKNPVALGHDENSWFKNRRVEIKVRKK